jgi:nucleotide-binding universal stress UspA family protein
VGSEGRELLLCAVDATEDARTVLAVARELAAAAECDLRVAHVREWLAAFAPSVGGAAEPGAVAAVPPDGWMAGEHPHDAAEAWLVQLGVPEEQRLPLEGDIESQLLGLVAECGPWLAVTGTRSVGGLHELFAGSTARALMDDATCPVVVVPADAPPRISPGPVVCGVPADEDAARRVGALAARLARTLGRPLVLVHAMLERLSARPEGDRPRAKRALGAAEAIAGDLEVRVETPAGGAADHLPRIADEQDAALIVVGTRAHGPLRRLVLGSPPDAAVRRGHRPVAVLRVA